MSRHARSTSTSTANQGSADARTLANAKLATNQVKSNEAY